MNFKVGDKIVCIVKLSTDPNIVFYRISHPSKDEEVTVRGFCAQGGVLLEEYKNAPLYGVEPSFNQKCFIKREDNFADQILEGIKEEIKKEQLVEIN